MHGLQHVCTGYSRNFLESIFGIVKVWRVKISLLFIWRVCANNDRLCILNSILNSPSQMSLYSETVYYHINSHLWLIYLNESLVYNTDWQWCFFTYHLMIFIQRRYSLNVNISLWRRLVKSSFEFTFKGIFNYFSSLDYVGEVCWNVQRLQIWK